MRTYITVLTLFSIFRIFYLMELNNRNKTDEINGTYESKIENYKIIYNLDNLQEKKINYLEIFYYSMIFELNSFLKLFSSSFKILYFAILSVNLFSNIISRDN